MATVTKENLGRLHDKLILKLEKADYLPSFEKVLKDYSKKANIPGFRKGQVPAGLIKKMYGNSLFTDEVLKTVDRELGNYLESDKLNIFAQPLPLEMDVRQIDVNNPAEYTFQFEVGMKQEFNLPDWASMHLGRFDVTITEEMIEAEITRLQNRHGNMKDEETVNNDENVLNVNFTETDAEGNELPDGLKKDNSLLVKYFNESFRPSLMGLKVSDTVKVDLNTAFDEKEREWVGGDLGITKDTEAAHPFFNMTITKVGLLEKRELDEAFYEQLYPGEEIKTESDFRKKISDGIKLYWDAQTRNQLHDQLFHELVDHTNIEFPEEFLKRWMKTQGDPSQPKTDEEVEEEFPNFLQQLKWTLITDKVVQENGIQVNPQEIRDFAKHQLFSYMGGANFQEDQPWLTDYIEKMMKDRKFVEDAYNRIQTQKIFEWAETQVTPAKKPIDAETFRKMVEEHKH